MARKRYDAMSPVAEPTWEVVENSYGELIAARELPPMSDPRVVMIRALARCLDDGFLADELPGDQPMFFCTRGDERRMVTIRRLAPNRSHISPSRVLPEWPGNYPSSDSKTI